jgi:cytochrome P450
VILSDWSSFLQRGFGMEMSKGQVSHDAYRPPAPVPKIMLSLAEGELLSMLPQACYEDDFIQLRKGKRPIVLVNDLETIRTILVDKPESFPKSDVMTSALDPLLGDGILISNDELWHRQRAMLEPAFAKIRAKAMFPHIERSLLHCNESLSSLGDRETALESILSALALEVICRSIFSDSLSEEEVQHVYKEFSLYQKLLPQAGPLTIFGYRNDPANNTEFLEACRSLRSLIDNLIVRRVKASRVTRRIDILQSILDAQHPVDGVKFSHSEIVDQIMVFFLAGHETSASAMTWMMFILYQQEKYSELLRDEIGKLAPRGFLSYDSLGALTFARNVFLETLRLYPPAAFLTRRAKKSIQCAKCAIEAGSLIVISPWILHRHRSYWDEPDFFMPDRFSKSREDQVKPGSFIPFGLGQRICTGRALAMVEVPFLVAELIRRFEFEILNAAEIRPIARLTVRPNVEMRTRIRSRNY